VLFDLDGALMPTGRSGQRAWRGRESWDSPGSWRTSTPEDGGIARMQGESPGTQLKLEAIDFSEEAFQMTMA
jgi:hypothetical protein